MNEHEMDYQNPEHLRERADAIEAHKAGKPVELMFTNSEWLSCSPAFDLRMRYRPAPEPKPNQGWTNFKTLLERWQQANGDLCGTLEDQA